MALSTVQTNASPQNASLTPSPEHQWTPGTPDMRADIDEICESWGIIPPDFNETKSTNSPLSDEELSALSFYLSGFSDPVGESVSASFDGELYAPELIASSPWSIGAGHLAPLLQCPDPAYASASDVVDLPGEVVEAENSPSEAISRTSRSECVCAFLPPAPARGQSESRTSCPGPVAPSKRPASLPQLTKSATRPYPLPSMRAIHRQRTAAARARSLYPEQRSPRSGGRELEAHPVPERRGTPEAGGSRTYAQIVLPRERTPAVEYPASRVRCGRLAVPLGQWRPMRAPKLPREASRVVEFWTEDTKTGDKTPGTCLTDRFLEDTGRLLMFEDDLPFPGKKEKGFNLRILWPGYPEFAKKISVHKPLSECTIRDVRDWTFNAVSDFIRTPGVRQGGESEFWRVGAEDHDAIHLEDLVLVRLKQAGKGTWVPELDLLDWVRTV